MITVYLKATVTDMRRVKPNANPNAFIQSSSVHIVTWFKIQLTTILQYLVGSHELIHHHAS